MIIQDGLRRMLAEQEDVFYYLTLMNENYPHPAMPEGAEEGILRGHVPAARGRTPTGKAAVQLLGSGTILREVLAAPTCSRDDFGVAADVWSVTSFTELRARGHRGRALEPAAPDRGAAALVRRAQLAGRRGPGGRGDRLHAGVRRPDPPVRAPRRTACSAPTASAAATTASSCAASSRSTATTSRWPRSRRWPTGQGRAPAPCRRRSSATSIDPERPAPCAGLSEARPWRDAHRGPGPRHRRLHRRPGHRGPRRAGRHGRRRRTRSSRSSPTRRRWTCPRRWGRGQELKVASATRSRRARCCSRSSVDGDGADGAAGGRAGRAAAEEARRSGAAEEAEAARGERGAEPRPRRAGAAAAPAGGRRRPSRPSTPAPARGAWRASSASTWAGHRHRAQGPDPQGGRRGGVARGPPRRRRRRPPRRRARRATGGLGAAVAEGRLREVRRGRARPLSRIKKIRGPVLPATG